VRQLCKRLHIFVRAFQYIIEVGGNLEQAAELLVIVAENLIKPAFADQDDFYIERNWLRLQRRRADKAQRIRR